jgi:glycosyltransferase involved in cell wall biosynthesis
MKVLHVIPSLSRADGGPTAALALMERALAAQGLELETAATDDDGPGQRNGKPCGRPLPENGALHWYFAKRLDFYKVSPSFAHWIAREAGRYDLLHIHALFSFTTSMAARAARRARVPYIIRPMGSLDRYGMNERRPRLKALSMRLLEGPILGGAAAVHFTSEAEAIQARALQIPFREVIIPLAVENFAPARLAGDSPFAGLRGSPCVLFLSRLDPKKNLEQLLAAVSLLKDDFPSLHLLIAGGGASAYVAYLKSLAGSLGISAQVTWAGYLEGEQKAAALAAADVFVLPSYSENFGIAAAEALAAGLPCVLGRGVAIAKDVVQAQAGVSVETDAASIAEGLRRIIGAKEGLTRMSANASRLAQERFSTQAMGARLKQLYTDILDGSNGFPGSH